MPPAKSKPNISAQEAGKFLAAKRREKRAEDVAFSIGTTPSYYSTLENGKTDWRNSKYADSLVFELGFNAQELLQIGAYRLARLIEQTAAPPLLLEPTVSHVPDVVVLQVRALADAGSPHTNIKSDLGEYIMPRAKYRNGLEIFIADGQSMRRTDITGIKDKSNLVVDTFDQHLRDGKVYVICDDAGGFTVKRARDWNGQWWLTSDNTKFPPFQLSEAQIVGRVIRVESEEDF